MYLSVNYLLNIIDNRLKIYYGWPLNNVGIRGTDPHAVNNPSITLTPQKLNYQHPIVDQKPYR